ncbi:unnamed protein product [Mytilus coruscus]|uniref:Immunoglobulin subtype domain-containing protein n=1 Tax=Mytilus coruscus TaxID=42192 RepID=A0A6J8BEZ4_MYTCO|nr:unnamed protein product [Mytilus coruscus]
MKTRSLITELWFINQTDRNKIVGQEGTDLDITCSSDTGQFIAALVLESNETIKAIGDNQSVSYSFKPDRTDHLSKYKCVDNNRSSIMIEITLFIRCSPVFAKENKYVKIGKVGHSIKLSFRIYSYPDNEEIFLEKLGGTYSRKRKITNFNNSNSTLRYTGFENKVGIQGYEILIEIEILDIKDFRAYCITATNRLGASDYHFEIIKKEDTAVTKRNMTRLLIPSIVGVVLFGFVIIVYVCFWVKRTQVSAIRDHIVRDDPNYEEIWPISYRAVSNVRSSHSNDSQDQNLTHPGTSGISKRVNVQSFVDNENNTSDEASSDFSDIQSLQRETTEVHRVSISSNDTHVSNIGVAVIPSTIIQSTDNAVNCNQCVSHTIKENSSSHISQSGIDFGSGPSNNVIDGSVGDEDENPYEFIW